jgi:hypothetical protein
VDDDEWQAILGDVLVNQLVELERPTLLLRLRGNTPFELRDAAGRANRACRQRPGRGCCRCSEVASKTRPSSLTTRSTERCRRDVLRSCLVFVELRRPDIATSRTTNMPATTTERAALPIMTRLSSGIEADACETSERAVGGCSSKHRPWFSGARQEAVQRGTRAPQGRTAS